MSEFSRTNLFTAPLPRISQSIAVPLSRKFARLRNPQNLNEDAESLTGPENIIAGPIHQNKPVSSVPNGLGDPMKIKRSKTSQALDRTKTEKSRKRPAPEDQEKTAQQYKADTLDILAVNAGIDSTPPITSVSPSEMFVNNESMSEEPRRLRLRDEDDFDDLLRRHEEITQAAGIGEPKSAGAMRKADHKSQDKKKKKKKKSKSVASPVHKKFEARVPCAYWLKGSCQKGADCTFIHAGDPAPARNLEVCKYFKTNSCHKGELCPFPHDLKLEPCIFYHMKGFCNTGEACFYSHGEITEEQYTKLAARYTPQPKPSPVEGNSYVIMAEIDNDAPIMDYTPY